ncbi:MAG: hypothetical protein WCX79_00985 [Candidatus Paceibacterota bacterium]|jgi:hypothetical protein
MIKRTLYETRSAAYHESGHTIAALILQQDFRGVTIKQRKHSWGRLEGYKHGSPLARAIVYLTGPLAQSKILNQDIMFCGDDYYLNCGGGADFNNACVELNWIHNVLKETSCKRKLYISVLDTSKEIVNNNRDQIQLLAKELLKEETIWYSDILKLLIKNKMFDSMVVPKMPSFERV